MRPVQVGDTGRFVLARAQVSVGAIVTKVHEAGQVDLACEDGTEPASVHVDDGEPIGGSYFVPDLVEDEVDGDQGEGD